MYAEQTGVQVGVVICCCTEHPVVPGKYTANVNQLHRREKLMKKFSIRIFPMHFMSLLFIFYDLITLHQGF